MDRHFLPFPPLYIPPLSCLAEQTMHIEHMVWGQSVLIMEHWVLCPLSTGGLNYTCSPERGPLKLYNRIFIFFLDNDATRKS